MTNLKTFLFIAVLIFCAPFISYGSQNSNSVEILALEIPETVKVEVTGFQYTNIVSSQEMSFINKKFLPTASRAKTTISFRPKRSWKKSNVVKLHDLIKNFINVAKKTQESNKEEVIIIS
ncbi:hypothetical protein [Aquimarina pacifica]|uniref:hypothetical protein n=1 Tax=Aquimarina pacifica TaxID=1296415 RepID=UPI00046F73B4|nr:hypothetical protein [Aquimarina pacifica]